MQRNFKTIGVYHIELKLPDAMRTLQFGAVSLTLPVAIGIATLSGWAGWAAGLGARIGAPHERIVRGR